jgi:iron complex transport system ATP-binding protein
VRNLVAMGRYPYQNWLQQWSKEDEIKVEEALSITKTTEIADRLLNSLSGGQRQRAWIAMVLAQDTNILLLDEPTTYLDLAHQIELLDLLQQLHETKGKTIVMVLHDLNLACRYADYLVAVKQGKIYAMGSPKQVMTEDMVQEVFGLKCRIIPDPLVHSPMCIPRLCRKKFKKTEGGATNY